MLTIIVTSFKSQLLVTALRWIAVLVFFFISGLGGFILVFGPLGREVSESTAAGIVFGMLGSWLMARQQIAILKQEKPLARRLGLFHSAAFVFIFLGVGGLSLVQMTEIGAITPLGQDRLSGFDRLWKAIDKNYPYFEQKQVDWDEVYHRYRPQIEQAGTEEVYFNLISSMLAELHDSHTGLASSPLATECMFARIIEVEGKALVTDTGLTAEEAGIEPGAIILSVDGLTPGEKIEALDLVYTSGSSPWQSHQRAYSNILITPMGQTREVSFETAEGELYQTDLFCQNRPGGSRPDEEKLTWERLPSGVGLIRIRSFSENLVEKYDTALAELKDAPGLIIDLRGNGGGNSRWADAMAGRLIEKTFIYGYDHFQKRIPQRAWRSSFYYQVRPRQPVYQAPLILLIDTWVMSSAEQFGVALVDSGRVTTVGRRTGGSSGNPIVFKLPGGAARFSTGYFTRMDGTPLEGVGIQPDHEVYWSIEDFRLKRDPDLAKAEEILLQTTR
jgi:carboxyl-terminal processing protease